MSAPVRHLGLLAALLAGPAIAAAPCTTEPIAPWTRETEPKVTVSCGYEKGELHRSDCNELTINSPKQGTWTFTAQRALSDELWTFRNGDLVVLVSASGVVARQWGESAAKWFPLTDTLTSQEKKRLPKVACGHVPWVKSVELLEDGLLLVKVLQQNGTGAAATQLSPVELRLELRTAKIKRAPPPPPPPPKPAPEPDADPAPQ